MSDKPDGYGLNVDLMPRPNWAAVEGKEKALLGLAGPAAFLANAHVIYTVPAGKKLYIVTASAAIVASAAADGDLPQHGQLDIRAPDIGTIQLYVGGDGGFAIDFSTPIVVDAGDLVAAYLTSYANHNVDLVLSLRGYMI
jgi:hypothetical protein